MLRRFIGSACLAAISLAPIANAEDVLLLGGGETAWTDDVRDVLEGHGHEVEIGPEFYSFSGHGDLESYDVVFVLAETWWGAMPVAGQEAIDTFVRDGGGLVTSEWLSYTLSGSSTPLDHMLPVEYGSALPSASVTYTKEFDDDRLGASLPSSFTFNVSAYGSPGSEAIFTTTGDAITYYSSAAGPAVVGRRHGMGRVISFNTLMSPVSLASLSYRRLISNAVRHSASGLMTGDGEAHRIGHSLSYIGDTYVENDFVVGMPFAYGSGAIRIHNGAWPAQTAVILHGDAGDRFGWATAAAGDLSGSGWNDLLISAPFNDDRGNNAGAVHVMEGASGSIGATVRGRRAGDRFGFSIAAGLDLTGDGVGDFVVGAPKHDASANNTGRVYVYDGATLDVVRHFSGENRADMLGWTVAMIPDLDGDGLAEVVAGAPKYDADGSNAGRVYIYSGDDVLAILDGHQAGAQFGKAIAVLSDLDFDGLPEFAVGSPNYDKGAKKNTGRVDVYSGADRSLVWKMIGGTAGAKLGFSVSNAGDVTGDGVDDVIVGAPRHADSRGRAYVRDGLDGAGFVRFTGQSVGDQLGHAVCGRLNAWGIGLEDILIAAPRADLASHVDCGHVTLVQFEIGGLAEASSIEGDASPVVVEDDRGTCEADFDGDGDVDGADVALLLAEFGVSSDMDLSGDGVIDVTDIVLVLDEYGVCRD